MRGFFVPLYGNDTHHAVVTRKNLIPGVGTELAKVTATGWPVRVSEANNAT